MTVTLKDLAIHVGKSVTTVSRALAGHDDVSPATRELVKQAAQELGYEPNLIAQQLQKKRTDTIALILPTYGPRLADPFFSEFLTGIGNEAATHGFDLLVSTRAPGDEENKAYLKNIRSRRVDGFIIVRTRRQDPRITMLLEHNYPFVAFGRIEGENNFLLVDEDSEYGMQLLVDHLVEQGHTDIAHIAAPSDFTFAYSRLMQFKDSLKLHNLTINPAYIVEGDLTQRSGRDVGEKLLSLPSRPTAIVACNDLMALGAINAAQAQGLVVGRDVAIAGFDDIFLAEYNYPSLTTVHQPIYHIGTIVCRMLLQFIKGEPLSEPQIILQPSLVVRQSTVFIE